MNSAGHRNSVFDESNGDAKLRNAFHELAGAVEGIDHPHTALIKPSKIVDAFFREPTFAVAQKILAKHGINGTIRFGHGIVASLEFRVDRSGREPAKDHASVGQSGFDTHQDVRISRIHRSFNRPG